MHIRIVGLSVALLVVLLAAPARPAPVASGAVDLARLVGQLRQGGYVIFFRHAGTNWGEEGREQEMKSSGRFRLDDCTTQRNLSPAGRDQARRLGAAFRALAIPVGRVAASSYCRTQETARLAFGWADPSALLTPGGAPSLSGAEALERLLDVPPLAGHDTILVGHGDMMRAGFGIDLGELEAVVLEADAAGRPRMLARVRLEEWEAQAARLTGGAAAAPAR